MYRSVQLIYRVVICLSVVIWIADLSSEVLGGSDLLVNKGRIPAGRIIVAWFFGSLLLVPTYLVVGWMVTRNNKIAHRALAIDILLGISWLIFFVLGLLISSGQGAIWLVR